MKHPFRDETEQEIVRRLEAFSDIVIGFSLGLLTLSLTIPKHGADLFAHVQAFTPILAFFITFLLVCGVWWMHHRLFRLAFVPTPVNIVLNFAALGGIVFLTYAVQVIVHVGTTDTTAFVMYMGSYAFVMLLFASLAWLSVSVRGARMPKELRVDARAYARHMSILATVFLVIAVGSGLSGVVFTRTALPAIAVLLVSYRVYRRIALIRARGADRPASSPDTP